MNPETLSAAPATDSWWTRLRHTPLSDVLRGRWTAALDPARVVADAGLTAPLAPFLVGIVRETRLDRREQVEVARELADHFLDGLAHGHSAETLVQRFGDVRAAARLIRRAKLRGRPLLWKLVRWTRMAILASAAVLGVIYGGLVVRYLTVEPQITHNYWTEWNDRVRVHSAAEQAWPVYRALMLEHPPLLELPSALEAGFRRAGQEFLDATPTLIPRLHEVARRPHLGYLIGDPSDAALAKGPSSQLSTPATGPMPLEGDNHSLYTCRLDGIMLMRQLAWLVEIDLERALAAGDAPRVRDDLLTLVRMGNQIADRPSFLVTQLIAHTVDRMALSGLGRVLAEKPGLLSTDELRDLAHEFAGRLADEKLAIDLESEQIAFLDVLQRSYSQDSAGDGWMTAEGISQWSQLAGAHPQFAPAEEHRAVELILAPGFTAAVASRSEERELFERLLEDSAAAHQGPAWTWKGHDVVSEYFARRPTQLTRLRHPLIFTLFPGVDAVFAAPERIRQQRDAVLAAVALVLFERSQGAWPASLEALVPRYLPNLPLDRADGRPLRYRLEEGQPLVYSIGQDGQDDQGRRPTTEAEEGRATYLPATTAAASGPGVDHILWPPQHYAWNEAADADDAADASDAPPHAH